MLLSNIQFLVQYIDILHLPIIAADTYDISVDSNLEKRKRQTTRFRDFRRA